MDIRILIKSIWKDILLTIVFVIISIPIWFSFDIAEERKIAYQSENNENYIGLDFLNNKVNNSLLPVNDEYAVQNYETQDLIVYNNTNILKKYKLLFKVYKKSKIGTDNLKISINNYIVYLKDLDSYEDDEAIYFILDSDSLVSSSQKYVISFWNDINAVYKENDILNYEYLVI